jgi:UDP-N-acetylglucosamine--N-acetylmuramyl-(pentapeptide) pyrophosphoryl-undecaprenol N-acetylglucosamine transferase
MFPAAAFAAEMTNRGWRVGLMTDERGRAYTQGFEADWIINVKAATFASKRPDKVLKAGLKILSGISEAKKKLRTEKADLVAGFGGYPAFPALAAASQAGIPILIHDQNAVLGRVNRFFARKARIVACGFERLDRLPAAALPNKRVVGNPVRQPIRAVGELPYPEIRETGRISLLVIGGSQGARLFGNVIPKAVSQLSAGLRNRLHVVQQVREEQIEEVRAIYEAGGVSADLSPFFSDMPERLANTHFVISRSGASSVTELAVAGRPSLLIPLAIAMDDHQTGNAETLVKAGAADILSEAAFTPEATAILLETRLADVVGLKARAAAARTVSKDAAVSDLADLAEGLI